MSLINRVQAVNFLNSNRETPEWVPAYRVVTIEMHGLSTAIHATNGIGKTTLTNALFWLLTRKKVYLDKIRSYGLSPRSEWLTHLRIEFIRPLPVAMSPQMPFTMPGIPTAPKGELWVVGVAAHREEDRPPFYFYQGSLEDAPVGRYVDGSPEVLADDEALENIKLAVKNKSGRMISNGAEWKDFIHNGHMSKHQLAMIEQFQLRGGGDKSSELYPVTVKGDETYDSAIFYTYIVPQLMSGIYVDKESERVDEAETLFEDTVIASCQQLCETRSQLQRGEEKCAKAKSALSGMEELSQGVDEIDATTAELDKALNKVAEMGLIVDTISESGLPGLPRWVESGDPGVDALLKHIVISPGEGPRIRAGGLDDLLGWPNGRTVERVSKNALDSVRLLQVIGFVGHKSCAKNFSGPKTGRYFSEENAIEFINRLSAAVLNIQEDEESGRERLQSIIRKAFAHFREQMDTSAHRAKIQILETGSSQAEATIKRVAKDIGAHEKTIEGARAEIKKLAPLKNEWTKVFECQEFSADEKVAPAALGDWLKADIARMDKEIGALNQQIGGIGESARRLVEFRNEYGEKAPLEVKSQIEAQICKLRQSIEVAKKLAKKIGDEILELQDARDSAVKEDFAAEAKVKDFELLVKAIDEVERLLPGIPVEKMASHLDAMKAGIDDDIKFADAELSQSSERRVDAMHRAKVGRVKDVHSCKEKLSQLVRKNEFIQDIKDSANVAYNGIVRISNAVVALLPHISILDEFDKRHGAGSSAAQHLKARREIHQRLLLKLQRLNGRMDDWKKDQALLKNEKPVPQKIMTQALGSIPKKFEYRCLLDLIEEAGLTLGARDRVIKTLSSVLFAPVVVDDESAAKIAGALDQAGYAVPVFLEAGVKAALTEGLASSLPSCVYGHITRSAEILLFPERRQEELVRLEKKIKAAQKGCLILQGIVKNLEDDSEEIQFLEEANTAQKRRAREEQRSLAGDLRAQEQEFERVISKWREVIGTTVFEGESSLSHIEVDILAEALKNWSDSAKDALGGLVAGGAGFGDCVFLEISKRVENFQQKLSKDLARIEDLLRENLEHADSILGEIQTRIREVKIEQEGICQRFKVKILEIESEYKLAFDAANGRRAAAVKRSESHESEYGDRSQFIENLRKAERCIRMGGRAELGKLLALSTAKKDGLIKIKDQLQENDGQLKQTESDELKSALLLERAEGNFVKFDFRALHEFIIGGEDAALNSMSARKDVVETSRNKLSELLRVADFRKAQGYVDQKSKDEFFQDALKNSAYAIENLKKEKEEAAAKLREAELQINDVAAEGLRYDMCLYHLQECMMKFRQIDVDFAKFKNEANSNIVDSVRQAILSLNSGEHPGDSGAEVLGDVKAILDDFWGEDKIRRVKEYQNKVDRLLSDYRKDVEAFLSREEKKLIPGMPEMIRETLEVPQKIRGLLAKLKESVEQEVARHSALSERHNKLWDEQLGRLYSLSTQAGRNYHQLCSVMKTYASEATFEVSATIASKDDITSAIEQVRDMVGEEVDRANSLVDSGDLARKQIGKVQLSKNSSFQKNVKDIMYRAIFQNPKISFRHPAISNGAKIRLERDCVSEGQTAAVQLLLLVRIAEYCKKRDDRQNRSKVKKTSRENGFIILDGLFSALSNDSLIQESLKALDACKDVFQLIGLIHNKGYVNDYDIFPTYIVGKKFLTNKKTQEGWHQFEEKRKGENGFFHSTVINTAEAV